MAESRKAWIKPELVILVRNKPEEAILGACKGINGPDGPNNVNRYCLYAIDLACFDCDSIAPS